MARIKTVRQFELVYSPSLGRYQSAKIYQRKLRQSQRQQTIKLSLFLAKKRTKQIALWLNLRYQLAKDFFIYEVFNR